MGYIGGTGSQITVDAILTKKGRELLARGRSEFNITQFALADDEVDYGLYNPAHPSGSDYYGVILDNLPITEAVPDETQSMKYKLITLPRNTTRIPLISLQSGNISGVISDVNSTITLKPVTSNAGTVSNLNNTLGYTAILTDNTYVTLVAKAKPSGAPATIPNFVGDSESSRSITVIGTEFELQLTNSPIDADKTVKVILIGNETGGRVVYTATISQKTI